jgi:hypothetical protein
MAGNKNKKSRFQTKITSSSKKTKTKTKTKDDDNVGDYDYDDDRAYIYCSQLGRRGAFSVLFLFLATLMYIGLYNYATTTTTYHHNMNDDLPSRKIKNEKSIMSHNSSSIDGGSIDGILNSDNVEAQKSTTTNSSSSETKIIGFSDNTYKEIAWKWYKELESLGYTNHIIVASDVPAESYFKEKGMRYDTIHDHSNNYTTSLTIDQCADTYDNKWPEGKRKQIYRRRLFGSRWNYILRQLQQNHNVLLTDVDNVFVRYLDMSEFENSQYDSYHAYAGTVDGFPRNIYKKIGFTICGCTSWLRGSSPGVIELVKAMVARCGCETTLNCHCSCDDQVLMNSMMLTEPLYKVKWDDNNSSSNVKIPMKEEDMNWNSMTGTIPKTGHRVKIWDRHTAFRRHYDPNDMICPDKEKSWISMPSGLDRMKVREIWMDGCGGGD